MYVFACKFKLKFIFGRVCLPKIQLYYFYSTKFTLNTNTLAHPILVSNAIMCHNGGYKTSIGGNKMNSSNVASKKHTQFVYVCELMGSLDALVKLEYVLNNCKTFRKMLVQNASGTLTANVCVRTTIHL